MKQLNNILLLTFLSISTLLMAQHPSDLPSVSDNAAIIGKSSSDGIMLRWAPKRFSIWQLSARNGWLLERAEFDENDWPYELKKLSFTKVGRFKAYTKNEWESKSDINDPYVAVAAQALFGSEEIKAMPAGAFADLRLIADLQDNRHALAMLAADLSANAAKGLGISYTDQTAEIGKDYVYRLRLEKNREGFGADTVYHFIRFDGTNELVPEVLSVVTEGKHGAVDVFWNKDFNQNFFTAYYVERSENRKNWQRLNKIPLTTASGDDQPDVHLFTDTLAIIGKKYFYRIIGITPFAETSAASDGVIGIARDMIGPVPPQNVNIEQIENKFKLSWDTEISAMSPDFVGFKVKRSVVASGPYQELHPGILPKKQKNFIDTQPIPIMTNYYRVYAIDTANNESPGIVFSAVWADSTPPEAPKGLYATVDTSGLVTVSWTQNTEVDLQGYRVFVRDDKQKEWYQLTTHPIIENTFTYTISLASLNKSIEYSVVALDFHYNASAHSLPYLLKLPDLIAPSAPRWGPWEIKENYIQLNWYPSSATDLRSYRLFTSRVPGAWQMSIDLPAKTLTFADTIGKLQNVSYALIAVDSTGNVSDTVYLRNISSAFNETLPAPSKLQVKRNTNEKGVEISWQYKDNPSVHFVLYRKSTSSDDIEFVANVSNDARSYLDLGPTSFTDGFAYYLRAVASDGRTSKWADPVKVRLTP